jgi:hypothetical protein
MDWGDSYRDRVRRSGIAAIASLALLSLCAATTLAARPSYSGTLLNSPLLWATVDVCRSSAAGDVVGVRGSMPGTGNSGEQMYMIFRLQYRGPHDKWHYLEDADSGLLAAGSSQFRSRQAGLDFHLSPGDGTASVVRGIVKFEWRIATRVMHETKLETTAGHIATAGASPRGFSVAHCAIS